MSTELSPRPAIRTGRLARLARRFRPAARNERGMATAEYAVGTIAAVALVTVLIKVFRDGSFFEMLLKVVKAIFETFMAVKGFGV